jgi:hypothetical protein
VVNGYAFFVWYKGGMENRELMLSRKKTGTNNWVTIQFPEKNTLYTGEHNGVDVTGAGDSHKTAAVGVCPIDGTVHLAYDMHVHPLKYRISNKNIAFAPDSVFTLENFSDQRNYFREDLPIDNFTYPSFENNDAGELIVEYRLGTSRQGDKYITYYDGSSWSDLILLVKGDNEDPQFNQYGGLSYHFGKMYLGCAVRVYESPITYNQGFYFAEAGQHGDENWKNLKGETFQLPIRGLTRFNNFKVCEPIPPGNDGMTSSPELVVSKNGAVHMVNRVPDVGFVHYHTTLDSKTMEKASTSPFSLSFGGYDGRIYSVEISSGKIRVKSSPEGESNWRTDYIWNGTERFGLMKSVYHKGKIYIVASEDVDTDRIPLHYIVLDIVNDNMVPDGYTYVCDENDLIKVNATMDIAYGSKGEFKYKYNVNSDLVCSDEIFGDPNPGVEKKCYIKLKYPFTDFVNPPTDTVFNINYDAFGVSVNAVDSGGSIKHVALYLNDSVLIRTDSVPPFVWGNPNSQFAGELLGINCGKHTLKAVATDNDNLTSSDEFRFYVTGEECIPSITFVSPQADTVISSGEIFKVKASVFNHVGVIEKVALFADDRLIREVSAEPYEWGGSNHSEELQLAAGTYVLKLFAANSFGLSAEKTIHLTVEPFIHQIPGKIEAESFAFMKGIQTETTNDTDGGLYVGEIDPGDWMSYEVEIDTSAVYQVEYRVAAPTSPIRFYLKLDSWEVDVVESPATGDWQSWKSVNQEVYLMAGRHNLRIGAMGRFNINWLNFALSPAVGVRTIEAEDLSIYPNPFKNTLLVDFVNPVEKCRTLIYDSTGKMLFQKILREKTNQIDLTHLSNGIYFVEITEGTKTSRAKIIKQ